jgi:hypothetical protein
MVLLDIVIVVFVGFAAGDEPDGDEYVEGDDDEEIN